jgi:hypothetical protein
MNNNREVQELIQELTILHIKFDRRSEQIRTKIEQIQKCQNKKTKGTRNENKQNFPIRDISQRYAIGTRVTEKAHLGYKERCQRSQPST